METLCQNSKQNSKPQSFADALEPLRLKLENEYSRKLDAVKELYDSRLESLSLCARQIIEQVDKDDILQAMKESNISKQYAAERTQELYEDSMAREKEQQVAKLQLEIVELHEKVLHSRENYLQVEFQYRQVEEELFTYKQRASQLDQEVSESRKQLSIMNEESLKNTEKSWSSQAGLRNSAQELKHLHHQLESYRAKHEALEGQLSAESPHTEQLQQLNKKLTKERDALSAQLDSHNLKFQQIIQAEQKASTETFESIHKKFKSKTKKFKQKIIEQKNVILEQEQHLGSYRKGIDDVKKQIEDRQGLMHGDLKKVKEEWERRCSEIQLEAQRKEAELQSRHQLQVLSLQNKYQQLMDQNISELQEELQQNRVNKEDYVLKAKHEEATDQLRNAQENYNHLEENYRLLQLEIHSLREAPEAPEYLKQEIDNANVLIGKLQAACDEEKRRRREAEAELSHTDSALSALKRQVSELREDNKTLQLSKFSISEALKDLEFSQLRNKELASELAALYSEAEALKTRNSLLEGERDQVKEEIRSLSVTVKRAQEDRTRHIEEGHLATRSKLLQAEGKISQLTDELKLYEKRTEELKAKLRASENEQLSLGNKLHEFDSELSLGNNEKRTLHKQLGQLASFNQEYKQRTSELVKAKLRAMKAELSKLRTALSNETLSLRKSVSSSVQDLMFKCIDANISSRKTYESKLCSLTEEMSAQWAAKLQGLETSLDSQHRQAFEQYKVQIHSQEKLLEELRQNALTSKKQQQNYLEDYEKTKRQNSELRQTVTLLSEEKENATKKLARNSAAFDKLQEEVRQETHRIKQTSDKAVEKSKKDCSAKYEQELSTLNKHLQEANRNTSERLTDAEEAYRQLAHQHETELTALKKRYQNLLDQAYSELDTVTERNTQLQQQHRESADHSTCTNKEYEFTIKSLNSQVLALETKLKTQLDRSTYCSVQSSAELDTLRIQLNEAQQELATQSQERERLRVKFQELQEKIQAQANNFYAQLALKDKEIAALKETVDRSYLKSLDHVRRAQELDRETQELTKQARKPSNARGSAFSGF